MIVTTNLIKKPFDAVTAWPFIFIRPEYKDNLAMLAHETVHYKSMAWVTPFWWLRYILSKSFRWSQELKAYRVQIDLGGITAPQAAELLVEYDIGRSYDEALAALQA